jgi:hypothetical protein
LVTIMIITHTSVSPCFLYPLLRDKTMQIVPVRKLVTSLLGDGVSCTGDKMETELNITWAVCHI